MTSEHKEDFSSLVSGTTSLSGDEAALLKAAEARALKSHTSEQFVGKTIGAIIADQRQRLEAHQQLAHIIHE